MTFTVNFMALSTSEMEALQLSSVGWIVIAITWSVVGALWLAGGFLNARKAAQSTRPGSLTDGNAADIHGSRVSDRSETMPREHCYLRPATSIQGR